MIEEYNQTKSEVYEKLTTYLKDYKIFRDTVKYKTRLYRISLVLLCIGLSISVGAVVNYFISEHTSENFYQFIIYEVMLDEDAVIFALLSIGAIIFGIIGFIIDKLNQNKNFAKAHAEFLESGIIKKEKYICFLETFLAFYNASDEEIFLKICQSKEFTDNSRIYRMLEDCNLKKRRNKRIVNNFFKKKFGMSEGIYDAIIESQASSTGVIKLKDGFYLFQIKINTYTHEIKIANLMEMIAQDNAL